MFIKKMTNKQIKDILKTMLLFEARTNSYYSNNLQSILSNSLMEYSIMNSDGNEYIVGKVKNGDIFVFDDCNYIKFEVPNMNAISNKKNTDIYLNFMRDTFDEFPAFEIEYNQNLDNIVNFVNFCDELIYNKHKKSSSSVREYSY